MVGIKHFIMIIIYQTYTALFKVLSKMLKTSKNILELDHNNKSFTLTTGSRKSIGKNKNSYSNWNGLVSYENNPLKSAKR